MPKQRVTIVPANTPKHQCIYICVMMHSLLNAGGTNTVTSVASNLFHEWLHKVGFGHAVNYSVSRDYSVPYAVGRIIGSIGKQFD